MHHYRTCMHIPMNIVIMSVLYYSCSTAKKHVTVTVAAVVSDRH